jgi:N-methylhydantoinase B
VIDPVQLEIFKSLFHSIAEEMGATLKRTAFSPNIKERRDYSCAVFDRDGNMVSQGDHMPVHLGSMPLSVKAAIENRKIGPGDMVILNDPYAGGTHLPDITLVSGVVALTIPMSAACLRAPCRLPRKFIRKGSEYPRFI